MLLHIYYKSIWMLYNAKTNQTVATIMTIYMKMYDVVIIVHQGSSDFISALITSANVLPPSHPYPLAPSKPEILKSSNPWTITTSHPCILIHSHHHTIIPPHFSHQHSHTRTTTHTRTPSYDHTLIPTHPHIFLSSCFHAPVPLYDNPR